MLTTRFQMRQRPARPSAPRERPEHVPASARVTWLAAATLDCSWQHKSVKPETGFAALCNATNVLPLPFPVCSHTSKGVCASTLGVIISVLGWGGSWMRFFFLFSGKDRGALRVPSAGDALPSAPTPHRRLCPRRDLQILFFSLLPLIPLPLL